MKKTAVLLCVLCALAATVSCEKADKSMSNVAEMDYVNAVEAIIPTEKGFPVMCESLEEMISTSKCNLIIRGKIADRGECETDGTHVTTPYTVVVNECFLGDFEVGGIFVIDAPYGIAENVKFRAEPHPILRTGEEYIMFLRRDEIDGEMYYYLANRISGALRIDDDGLTNDTEGNCFSDSYGGDLDAFIGELKFVVESGSFDTSYDIIG